MSNSIPQTPQPQETIEFHCSYCGLDYECISCWHNRMMEQARTERAAEDAAAAAQHEGGAK